MTQEEKEEYEAWVDFEQEKFKSLQVKDSSLFD